MHAIGSYNRYLNVLQLLYKFMVFENLKDYKDNLMHDMIWM